MTDATRHCPMCKKMPAEDRFRPFCSKRCADLDLNRWFTGHYAIGAEEGSQDPDEEGRED